jgi:hypothetical protein
VFCLLFQQQLLVLDDKFIHISVFDLDVIAFQLSLELTQLLRHCHVLLKIHCFRLLSPSLPSALSWATRILLVVYLLAGRWVFRVK